MSIEDFGQAFEPFCPGPEWYRELDDLAVPLAVA